MAKRLMQAVAQDEGNDAHVLHVLDASGDTRIVWDPSRPVEVEHAQAAFDKAKRDGYVAYSVKRDGSPDKVVTTFDPKAEKLILAPAVRGG